MKFSESRVPGSKTTELREKFEVIHNSREGLRKVPEYRQCIITGSTTLHHRYLLHHLTDDDDDDARPQCSDATTLST